MQRVLRYAGGQAWRVVVALSVFVTILGASGGTFASLASGEFGAIPVTGWLLVGAAALALAGLVVFSYRAARAEGFVAPDRARIRGALVADRVKWVAALEGREVVCEATRCPDCDVAFDERERAIGDIYADGGDAVADSGEGHDDRGVGPLVGLGPSDADADGGMVGAREGKRSGDLLSRTERALVCPECDRVEPTFAAGAGAWRGVRRRFRKQFRRADQDFDAPEGAWQRHLDEADDPSLRPADEGAGGTTGQAARRDRDGPRAAPSGSRERASATDGGQSDDMTGSAESDGVGPSG